MRGDYYYHPNWETSVPSQKNMENSTPARPNFPSCMYESPCPPHNHCHTFPSSPMQCCHSCCHNTHGHHYPLYPSPTPHPYTYSPPPPYYHPHCCGGGGGYTSHHPQPSTYSMPCYGYVPPPDYADPSGYEYGKCGRGEILYPCGGGFPRPPYPYGRKREDGNVKIEEHEEDPDGKDTTLNLVPAGNVGLNGFPYTWVPSGYKENKDKGKRDKPPLGRETEERLQDPDQVMKPGSYYVDPKAFVQGPNRWKGGWIPLDVNTFGSPCQVGEQKQQEQQKGQKSNQVPVIWMPYYSHPAENDDDQARDRKELSADAKIGTNEQPSLRQNDGIKRKEEDHENRVRKEKSGNLKIIPVKQIHDKEPVQMSGTNKDAELKKSVVSPGKSFDESTRNKESNGGSTKSKTLSPTKARLPPVCLRVDPLPKKNKNGKSSSGRSPPLSSRKEQKEGGDSVNSVVPSASKDEANCYDDSDKRAVSTKDKSRAEQSSKKEIRVTDAVDSSASQNRIEVSRTHSKHAGTGISKAAADQDTKVVKGEEARGVCASNDSRDGDDGSKKRESGEVKPVEEEQVNEPEKKKKQIMSGTEAAIVIQSAYRGYEVRRWQLLKKLKNIAKVRGEAAQLRSRIEAFESADYVGLDFSKEKSALAETIMKLLLDLDTIQGLHPSFRDIRKALASELINLQEKLDSITVKEKVKPFDGKTSFGEPAVENLDEGFKIGEERETMIQEDTSTEVSDIGSIAVLDATTSSNGENAPQLVHDEAQDRSKVEVATTGMTGTGTKVEETEASSLEEHEKVHCVAASELADKDAQKESQDDIMVLKSSSIEKRGECDNGELIIGELQGQNEEVLDGGSGFSQIEAHSQPTEEADVGDVAIKEESTGESLVDGGPSFTENQDGGVVDNVSAESTIEEMAKRTQEEVAGQEDSIVSPTLGEVQEVDLLANMPRVVDEKPVVPESMQQEFAEITSSEVTMDIASMSDSGDIDACEAKLAETLNEGLCCGELHDVNLVECRESGEYPHGASSEPEILRDVEIGDETSKISEEMISPSVSFEPNVVGKDENHVEAETVADEKDASCAENNVTRDDTERGNNGIEQPSGIELAVNEVHGSGISIPQSNDDGGNERPGGTELAVKEVPGSETSTPQESSDWSSKGRDETEPLSHSRGEQAQHAWYKEPETDNHLTQENRMLKEMIEKLVVSGKEQQDVISNLSGKIKELEKKLVKKKNTKAKTGKRPRILIHRSSFTKPPNSALGQVSEAVPSCRDVKLSLVRQQSL